MSGEKVGEAYLEVHAKTDQAEGQLRSSLGRIGGMVAGAFAVSKVVDFTGSVISAASDMGETMSKVGVIFGDGASDIERWASTAASTMGQSSNQAMQAASTMATFGKMAGLTGQDLTGFATDLTGLASDLASFNNTSPEEAINAIGAALRGEAEPIRSYGVLLDDATLRNRAFAMGIISSTKDALTPQQKVLAAQAEIMAQTSDAQGDFERTSGGLANQQRILAAQFEDVKVKLGSVLLPVATKVVSFLVDNMGPAFDFVKDAVGYLAAGFGGASGEGEGFFAFMGRVGEIARQVVDVVRGNWPTIRAVILEVFDAVGVAVGFIVDEVFPRVVDAVSWVVEWVRENWPQIQATVAEVIDWIGANVVPVVETVMGYIVEQAGHVVAWVQENWPQISATISAVLDHIQTVIRTVLAVVKEAWSTWGNEVLTVVQTAFEFIRSSIENAVNLVQGIIRTVMAIIRGDWGEAWDGIKQILGAVWDQIRNVVSTALSLLGTGLSAAWDGIKLVASAAWDGVKALVGTAIDGIVDFVTKLPGRLLGLLSDLGSAALDLGEKIVEKIGEGLAGLGDAIAKPFKSAWNAIAGWWNSNVGNWSFSIPDWVPGIGGNGFSMPDLPKFHRGGLVPGRPQDETLALLRGGERVVTEEDGAGGMGTVTALSIGEAHFHAPLDLESVSRHATSILADLGVAA